MKVRLPRGVLFQVHLWLGVSLGFYICLISLSGAALLFRIELQRLEFPHLLTPTSTAVNVDVAEVVGNLRVAYARGDVIGVDAPTTARPVYLGYVSDHEGFHTVLADPATGNILGELPDRSAIATLQNLHFNLMSGEVGELVNGIGALCLALLGITGAVIWWPGRKRWRQRLTVRWRGNPERRLWELHGATGAWSVVLILLWAVTALSFTFPRQFRAVVNVVSPLSHNGHPESNPRLAGSAMEERPALRDLIARAAERMPRKHVARVVLPSTPSDPVQVLFSPQRPTPAFSMDLTPVFLDQYSGKVMPALPRYASMGDRILEWAGPLHVGNFGGWAIRVLWLILGLAPSVLFVTGFITWWRRVVRPAYAPASAAAPNA